MVKAVGMFSGGLDSILAAKLIQQQGIDVRLVNFTTLFFPPKNAIKMARQIRTKLEVFDVTQEYLRMLRNPRYGYGSGLNPCIDCKILMLRKAKKYAKKIGAKFIFTGEVLGERPMSQNKNALELIEKNAGLKGRLLRPLSAKLLPITEAEKKWVDRERLLDIEGRVRERQISLAKKFKVRTYPTPAGGCYLTNKEYSSKAKDLLVNSRKISNIDIMLLKIGRHFRLGKNKIIVGRNREDNKELRKLKSALDFAFEVPKVGSPLTLLQGPKSRDAVEIAARLTARYSDSKENLISVNYGKRLEKVIQVSRLEDDKTKSLMVTSFS
jgi:tRNA-uridine 2-sulfurtransferase